MTGTVYSGINNIYRVRTSDDTFLECRIKGKILEDQVQVYNPLAPGDLVEVDGVDTDKGLILRRLPRTSRFARWNRKRDAWQTVAANPDRLYAVISTGTPPFRPRFVDRVLIAASQGGVRSAVLINKTDLGMEQWVEDRIDAWRRIGIEILLCSAETGRGLEALKTHIGETTAVFFGPSGVGKSTLINCLVPDADLATGAISRKYDRGRHVTNFGRLIDTPWGGRLVDTPGVREILVRGIDPEELPFWFPEISELGPQCEFQPCTHTHEPKCAVMEAAANGTVHPDRYENYLRIREELEGEVSW